MHGLKQAPGARCYLPRWGVSRLRGLSMAALIIFLLGTHAEAQLLSGIYCQGAELAVAADPNVRVQCEGALYFDRAGVIRSTESITLTATESMTLWGTLVAPRIDLTANGDLSVGGGLFSGSPDYFPEVRAVSWSGAPWENIRRFGDIVSRPIIDPIYGAVTFTRQEALSAIFTDSVIVYEFVLLPEHQAAEFVLVPELPANAVPEPASAALVGLGLALAAGVRGRR